MKTERTQWHDINDNPIIDNIVGNLPSDSDIVITDGKGNTMCIVPYGTNHNANAALIVKAVNCHAELLQALKECNIKAYDSVIAKAEGR